MSYIKTNWVNDETPISASNLNKIENQLEENTNNIEENTTNIGALNNLTTSNKTNIVNAINEVDENSSLNTQHISQLVEEVENIGSGLTSVNSIARSATTGVTTPVTLLETTITDEGVYLFVANIPINFYGQTGRDVLVRFLINDVSYSTTGGNSNADYTFYCPLNVLAEISANTTIKITIQDPAGKTYACTSFALRYIRLK